jgi:hypothetical protein
MELSSEKNLKGISPAETPAATRDREFPAWFPKIQSILKQKLDLQLFRIWKRIGESSDTPIGWAVSITE